IPTTLGVTFSGSAHPESEAGYSGIRIDCPTRCRGFAASQKAVGKFDNHGARPFCSCASRYSLGTRNWSAMARDRQSAREVARASYPCKPPSLMQQGRNGAKLRETRRRVDTLEESQHNTHQ